MMVDMSDPDDAEAKRKHDQWIIRTDGPSPWTVTEGQWYQPNIDLPSGGAHGGVARTISGVPSGVTYAALPVDAPIEDVADAYNRAVAAVCPRVN